MTAQIIPIAPYREAKRRREIMADPTSLAAWEVLFAAIWFGPWLPKELDK